MPEQLKLWLATPMRRIFHDDSAPRRIRDYVPCAARGDVECVQVGVEADARPFNFMIASVSDLKGPAGATIPAKCVDVLYPEFVPVKWATSGQSPEDVERKAPTFVPDPLLPKWEFDVAGPAAPRTRSVWLRVRVPTDAPPGLYAGSLQLSLGLRNYKAENQRNMRGFDRSGRIRFRLKVWDFHLPRTTALLTTNWFFPRMVSKWYEVSLWSSEFWRLLERFAEDMAAHRQNVILTPLFGAGRSEPPLIPAERQGRRWSFDFTQFERWCKLFLRRGFEMIEGAHIASRSTVAPQAQLPSGKPVTFRSAQDPDYLEFLRQFFSALWNLLGQRGWRGRYLQHVSDEPSAAQARDYGRLAEVVRGAAPGIKIIDAVANAECARLMDIPVPLESRYDEVLERTGREASSVWTYYCCGPTGPWPNRFLDYPLIRLRIITWLCFLKAIPGFLHWGYNYWGGHRKEIINPWDDTSAGRWPCGDPMMVYPPRDERMAGEIIGSIRWEIMREALEDYEYLRMLREMSDDGHRGARALLRLVQAKVAPDWTTYTRDHELMERVRLRMGELLSARGRASPRLQSGVG